jgi:hypothetical protein
MPRTEEMVSIRGRIREGEPIPEFCSTNSIEAEPIKSSQVQKVHRENRRIEEIASTFTGAAQYSREVCYANFQFIADNAHRMLVLESLLARCGDPAVFNRALSRYVDDELDQIKAGAGRVLHRFLVYLVAENRNGYFALAAQLRGQMAFAIWPGDRVQSEQALGLESRFFLLSIYDFIYLREDCAGFTAPERECLTYLTSSPFGPCLMDVLNATIVEAHPAGTGVATRAFAYLQAMLTATTHWLDY